MSKFLFITSVSFLKRGTNSLIPIRVQSLLDHTGRMDLLPIDRDDREWIRHTEDIALDQ